MHRLLAGIVAAAVTAVALYAFFAVAHGKHITTGDQRLAVHALAGLLAVCTATATFSFVGRIARSRRRRGPRCRPRAS